MANHALLDSTGDKRWFIIQAYSGYENRVVQLLKDRIKLAGLEDKFGDILVPTEEVIEMRAGKKRKTERKIFPGYVLVKMELDDYTWHLVREVPRVIGFIGSGSGKPSPITEADARSILRLVEEGETKPRPKVLFESGELVRVTGGPFAGFNATVEDVNYERNRLRVSVSIFGRATPVELEFDQVEKS